MFEWDLRNKVIAGSTALIILFSVGLYFGKIYQPPAKTDKIYSEALTDYNKGNYQMRIIYFHALHCFQI